MTAPEPSMSTTLKEHRPARIPLLMALPIATVVLLWSYWPTLESIVERWRTDPQYSHSFMVPPLALAILWVRRDHWLKAMPQASWWGVPILATAFLLHLAGTYFYFAWLDGLSLLPCVAGLVVLFMGPAGWHWTWPAILYLSFALPMPYQFEIGLAYPLQRIATLLSTYGLQTLGLPALSVGNVIFLDEWKIGVAEACSGLGMLVTFFALSTAFALLVQRPVLDKVVIFLSAAPIGVLVNAVRITMTGLLYWSGSPAVRAVFHDLAGWLMMPLAVALLWLELILLDRLFIQERLENTDDSARLDAPVPRMGAQVLASLRQSTSLN